MRRLPSRFLVVAASMPPDPTGGAVVLGRMLRGVDPRDYRLASFDPPSPARLGDPLPVPIRREERRWMPRATPDYPLRGVRLLRALCTEAQRRARRILDIARAEECRAVLAVTGSPPDLLAGALASRLGRLPLAVWMHDHWRHQGYSALHVPGAGMWLEGAVLRMARAIIVPNERLRDVLAAEHGRQSTVVHNPIEPAAEDVAPGPPVGWPADPQAPKIVYTGQLYGAQLDAVARLVEALEAPALDGWTLHLHASGSDVPGYLRRPGVIVHPVSDAAQARAVQRTADILFLPLAFASAYPDLIATASPTKLGDYLAAGRPILVHAPAGSYVATFASDEDFAEVVDEPAPELLAAAVLRITADAERRRRHAERAAAMAERFALPANVERFDAALAATMAADATADSRS